MLNALLSRRLLIVSGKGGVGKTTLSAAMGLWFKAQGKKVLLVEMHSTERIAPLFGQKPLGHRETELLPSLYAINLDPRVCFEEYLALQIPFKKLIHLFLDNKFVTRFLEAVPGLNELLMIGKIYELEKREGGKAYDLIIVDAPATGHGISTFEVPLVVIRAVKGGPMQSQALKIVEMLQDPLKTSFVPVTLAEEMPVVETLEFIAAVEKRLQMKWGPVMANALSEVPFTKGEKQKITNAEIKEEHSLHPYFFYSRYAIKRVALQEFYLEKLEKELGEVNMVGVPFMEKIEGIEDLERIFAIR